MQVSILGPVEVVRDGVAVPVTGARVRRLLTRLALEGGRPVGPTALADAVWGEDVPAEITNALQSLVSRLRRALGGAATVTATPAGGYRLAVDSDDVDARRFERDAIRAHALVDTDPEAAVELLDAALRLWRGAALADLDADDAAAATSVAVAGLEGLHRRGVLDRLDALVRAGRPGQASDELAALVGSDPTDERAAGLLMSALAATGRTPEALAVYEHVRSALEDALGTDPSTELQRRHLDVLRSEPAPATRTVRSNLPAAVTRFVGRDDDVRRVGEALRGSRLVTLVGPGGSGKTRLAVESARAGTTEDADGVWLVELAKVADPADVLTAVVDSVGAWDVAAFERRVVDVTGPRDRLVEVLQAATVLLVLDNCEHVLGAAAELVDDLLGACPRLRVLATSREPLSLFGEQLFPVLPLGFDTTGLEVEELTGVPAVDLFVDRVHAVRPDFVLGPDNAEAVAQICRRLDGLPLAIELAAARSRTLPVEQVAERLGDRFRLLTGGSRTALPRHRTLRAVVDWSWGLLTDPERDLVERLAVFPGGVSPEAAAYVVAGAGTEAGGDDLDTEDLLAALVDKSLLQLHDGPRYRMLETIREFGTDRLAERGVLVEARLAHAAYFHDLALRLEPLLRGPDQLVSVTVSNVERDNFLTALQYLCDLGDAERAVGVAFGMAWLWSLRGEHVSAVTWLRRALAVPSLRRDDGGPQDSELRSITTGLLAMNLAAVEGPPAAQRLLEEHGAHVLRRPEPGDPPLLNLVRGLVPTFLGRLDEAAERVQQALDAGATGWERAMLLTIRALSMENAGDLAGMRGVITQALEAFEQIGDRFGLASALEGSARLLTLDGRLDEAVTAYERSGRLLAELGAVDDSGQSFLWIAQLRIRTGELDAADEAVATARARFERIGSWMGLVLSDVASAGVARERGDPEQALALTDAAERRFRDGSTPHGPGQLLAICLTTRAYALATVGEVETARRVLGEARAAALRSTDMPVVALVVVAFASLAVIDGDPLAAAEVLGAADAIRGITDPTDPDVRRVEAAVDAAGPDATSRRARAASLSREDAVLVARRCSPAEESTGEEDSPLEPVAQVRRR